MYGITYNDKHSFKDLNLTILNTRIIKTPSKIKITESIPFSNITYDFSNLYGCNCYEERLLEYEFLLKANSNIDLEYKRIEVDNWLLSNNTKTRLIDDNTKDFYFLAECESVDFEELNNIGKLKAIFRAYPFRIGLNYEGDTLWDSFKNGNMSFGDFFGMVTSMSIAIPMLISGFIGL
jgi:phage-related protein